MQIQDRYNPVAIRDLFNEMSATYGMVNFISSFGFTMRWRNQAIKQIPVAEKSHIVDLMSGMNELCRSLSHHASPTLRVTAVDISPEMVRLARKNWQFPVENKIEDALTWNFEPASADAIISSFGLKTFDRDQQMQLAKIVARLLRPGGHFSFVEVAVPDARVLRWPYMFYLNRIIPWIGRLFLGNPLNYRMLGIYTQEFGNSQYFAECLQQQKLEVRTVRYFFGCAIGVFGTKPK